MVLSVDADYALLSAFVHLGVSGVPGILLILDGVSDSDFGTILINFGVLDL